MPESNFERNMIIVEQHWNSFISFIKTDINELSRKLRHVIVEIKKIERVTKLLQHSQNNIEFLLLHKESIINMDSSLTQKFAILEAFKKRDNLSNAVALRTFNEILNNENVRSTVEKLNSLKEKRDLLDEEIYKLSDLVRGTAYYKDEIIKYSEKHGLTPDTLTALLLYPILKSAEKIVPRQNRRSRNESTTSLNNDIIQDSNVVIENRNNEVEEVVSYKVEFDKQKVRYDDIKHKSNDLLRKYYMILHDMKPIESQYYRAFCSMTDDELNNQEFKGEYEEAVANIIAIKLFDAKNEIENIIQKICNNNYSNKDDIDYLEEYINELELLIAELQKVDKTIVENTKEIEKLDDSKVFFLADENGHTFIPENIKGKSLTSIINKAQEGYIQNKRGCDVKELKPSKFFKKECGGRTVFIVSNNKIIVSYIKINSGQGSNDCGIVILTATLSTPNTIGEDTKKVVKGNKERIESQIIAIENGDLKQMKLQANIRKEFMQSQVSKDVLREGESNGRTIK